MINRRSFLLGSAAAALTTSVAYPRGKKLQLLSPRGSKLQLLSQELNPNAYFVAPDGGNDSNPGSITKPFATIEKALSLAGPGYTVYCYGGRYLPSTGINFPRSGEEGRPITLQNYPGDKPIIDGSGFSGSIDAWPGSRSAGGALLSIWGKSYITIEGLEIERGPLNGIHLYGPEGVGVHWNIVRKCYIHHTGWKTYWDGDGLKVFGVGSYNLFEDIDSFYNSDLHLDNADGMMISLTGEESVGNVARRIRCGWNSDDGLDCYNTRDGTTQGPILFEDIWSWRNGFNVDGRPGGDGVGLKCGGQKATSTAISGGHTFRRFLTWGNRVGGVDENDAKLPLTFESGVAWKNGRNYYLPGKFTDHRMRACVSSRSTMTDIIESSIRTDCITVRDRAFVSLNESIATGPRPADGGLPAIDFLTLKSSGTQKTLSSSGAEGRPRV